MTLTPVKATPSDASRLNFAQHALSGALAMFSPWAPDPVMARQAFNLAWTACFEGARADAASKVLSKIYPLALVAIAKRAEAFDHELTHSPRHVAVVEAWRSLFGDIFESASGPVDEKSRLVFAARGPVWLVKDTKHRASPSRESCFLAAGEVFKRNGPERLGQVVACLPSDSHIFSTSKDATLSIAARIIEGLSYFAIDRSEIIQQFQCSFPGALNARERVMHAVHSGFWNSSAATATLSGLAPSNGARVDAFAATLAASCVPDIFARKISPDWAQSLPTGSLSEKDAIFLLLVAPEANFDLCARAVIHLAQPTIGVLHAGLARFASMSADQGQEGLKALAGLALSLGALNPADLKLPSARGSRAGAARLIGLNACELCLRAGMERKSSNRPHEVQILTSIMRTIALVGYDSSNAPSAGASTRAKMAQSKHAEARRWSAILETVELEAFLGSSASTLISKRPRL